MLIKLNNIYVRFILYMALSITGLLVVALLFINWVATSALHHEMIEDNEIIVKNKAARIDWHIQRVTNELKREISKPTLPRLVMHPFDSRFFLKDYMNELSHEFPEGVLKLYTFNGEEIYTSKSIDINAKALVVKAINSNEKYIVKILPNADGTFYILFIATIPYNNQVEGALAYAIPTELFFAPEKNEIGKSDMYLSLLYNGREILSHGLDKSRMLSTMAKSEKIPLEVVIDIRQDAHYGIINDSMKILNLSGIIAIAAIIVILVFMIRRTVIIPLYRLRDGVVGLQRAKWEPIETDSSDVDEIQDLIEAFNHTQEVLKERTSMLFQSEKMAAVGQLAAGVAHEINNPAGYVSANMESLKSYVQKLISIVVEYEKLPQSTEVEQLKKELNYDFIRSDLPELLEESIEGMDRISKIVSDLKVFSRSDELESYAPCLIDEVADQAISLAWNQLKYKCEVVRNYAPTPEVEINQGQITQVLLNLLINASQAITEKGTVAITISSQEQSVFIEISDNGCGVAPEELTKIFNPFFTTKPVGVGTGLGLHISQKIVKSHGGKIEVRSKLGEGTTFTIQLPLKRPQN